jgi:hypothetical protein
MRLTLLHNDQKPPPQEAIADELRPILSTLRTLLPEPGDLLPADDAIIMRQWPRDEGIDVSQVPALLARLVSIGLLKRVVIGREAHLCLCRAPAVVKKESPIEQTKSPTENPPDEAPKTAPASAEHRLFQLQMIADVETERVLLFRVGVVLELLGLITLLRQILLWYLAL